MYFFRMSYWSIPEGILFIPAICIAFCGNVSLIDFFMTEGSTRTVPLSPVTRLKARLRRAPTVYGAARTLLMAWRQAFEGLSVV